MAMRWDWGLKSRHKYVTLCLMIIVFFTRFPIDQVLVYSIFITFLFLCMGQVICLWHVHICIKLIYGSLRPLCIDQTLPVFFFFFFYYYISLRRVAMNSDIETTQLTRPFGWWFSKRKHYSFHLQIEWNFFMVLFW